MDKFAPLIFCVFVLKYNDDDDARLVERPAAITKPKHYPVYCANDTHTVRILLIRKDMKKSECRSEQICFNSVMPQGKKNAVRGAYNNIVCWERARRSRSNKTSQSATVPSACASRQRAEQPAARSPQPAKSRMLTVRLTRVTSASDSNNVQSDSTAWAVVQCSL